MWKTLFLFFSFYTITRNALSLCQKFEPAWINHSIKMFKKENKLFVSCEVFSEYSHFFCFSLFEFNCYFHVINFSTMVNGFAMANCIAQLSVLRLTRSTQPFWKQWGRRSQYVYDYFFMQNHWIYRWHYVVHICV